jgi:hypothetical protein
MIALGRRETLPGGRFDIPGKIRQRRTGFRHGERATLGLIPCLVARVEAVGALQGEQISGSSSSKYT